ncbi:hypothetical protein ACJRO7_027494 [Eucalyptus globulus]|uniref:Uncharacterized protein n=1 Tax=Eucalyptus globulus TaxID=34317 RepID=A0ABD3JYH9_EUCGL
MKSTKLILLHPTVQKQSSSNTNHLYIATGSAASSVPLPLHISHTLLHYAATTNSTHMTSTELATITSAIASCTAPTSHCNHLVFGLTTRPSYKNENIVLRFERQHPRIEAYDVHYETRVDEMKRLLELARGEFRGDCRTVQNLLFSDWKLKLNSLPNHVYELSWEVKLIDSLSGFYKAAQGRMSAIFTVAVLARSKMGGAAETHIFVLFLCRNSSVGKLGHFVVERASDERLMTEFCRASASANSSLSTSIAQLKDSQVADKEDDDSVKINGVTNIFLLSFR